MPGWSDERVLEVLEHDVIFVAREKGRPAQHLEAEVAVVVEQEPPPEFAGVVHQGRRVDVTVHAKPGRRRGHEHLVVEPGESDVLEPVGEVLDNADRRPGVGGDPPAGVEAPDPADVVVELPMLGAALRLGQVANPVAREEEPSIGFG